MTQLNTPQVKRASGGVDVYTGLLCVAFLVLAAGVGLMVKRNMDHSAADGQQGSFLKLVSAR